MNCEINLVTIWSASCVISTANEETKFAITDTKPCVPLLTLSNSGWRKTIATPKMRFKQNN